MNFRGVLVEEAVMEKGTKIVISELLIGLAVIDVLSSDNFVLMLESNVNVSNNFTISGMMNMETHNIMRMRTSSSRRSFAINHNMVKER